MRVSITLKCVIASLVVLAIILIYYYLNMDLICIPLNTSEIKCLSCMFVVRLYIIICECVMKINLLYCLLEVLNVFSSTFIPTVFLEVIFTLWFRSDFYIVTFVVNCVHTEWAISGLSVLFCWSVYLPYASKTLF